MAGARVRQRICRILIAGVAALVLSVVVLEHPGGSRGASGVPQRSSKVAVIPGFAPKPYPGTSGVPPLPVSLSQFASYHFSQIPADQVTPAALSPYDTVLVYGIRWSDISASGQAAINAFATTHKVLIWDADDTGAQAYSNFVHPFSTLASGEHGQHGASVVSYPEITNVLASDRPTSPYYLDPNQLVNDQHLISHMSAMQADTKKWVPALQAANKAIPNGGWVLAWSYGKIGDQTGLVVYSGIDADSLVVNSNPNYAVKELALDLAAPFRQTPAPCAPECTLPTGNDGETYAACHFAKRLPTHWVHRRVPIVLRTSVAAGITGQVLTRTGRVVARGREISGDRVRLAVRTKKLRSNRSSRLRAVIFVKGQRACTKRFRLKVDNVRPRLLALSTSTAGARVLELSVSEKVSMAVIAGHGYIPLYQQLGHTVYRGPVPIAAHRPIHMRLSASVKTARLILRDRAGNTLARKLSW